MVVAVVGALALSTTAPLWLGLSETAPWAQLVQLRVLSAALALVTAVVLAAVALVIALRRRRRPARTSTLALVLLLVAGAHGGVLLSRGALAAQVVPVARTGDLTMLALNVEGDGASTSDVASLARGSRADVLALSEVQPARGRAIGAELGRGGDPWTVLCAPADAPRPEPPNRYSLLPVVEPATCLVISPAMGPYEASGPQPELLGGGVIARPTAGEPGEGGGPPLAVVHTTPPIPLVFGMDRWRDEVAVAVAVCPSLDGAVVGGDYNATDDAAGLSDLGHCVDTAAGSKASGTWPSSLPAGASARIDHVLADGRAWSVVGTRTAFVAGTDHRALVSVLRPR